MMQVYDDTICLLGEGPLWHPGRGELFWFDVLGRRLHRKGQHWQFDEIVSAAGWVDDDTLLIASQTALLRFTISTGAREIVAPLEADNVATRSNDGRADPWGGFWIGTMGLAAETGAGSIHRFYRGAVRMLFDQISIPNAICFSPDRKFAYYADTLTRRIMRQPLDPAEGWPAGAASVHVDTTGTTFVPDGAVVSQDGILWTAQWGSARVAGYGPDGALVRTIDVPARAILVPGVRRRRSAHAFRHLGRGGPAADRLHRRPAQRPDLFDADRHHRTGRTPRRPLTLGSDRRNPPMKPTLGVCYYPEHWPEAQWAADAAQMRDTGITWVRIGEFAWSRMEPAPGRMDWGWLDRAIAVLGDAGLKVVLGTPTATPPRWMLDRHPDMLGVDAQGRPRKFGSRRHYCFSHAGYRDESRRIARLMAERYGKNPAVGAWQTDNEYSCHDTTLSYSDAARAGFRDWLAQRYQSTQALNRAWGNVFWSMDYDDWGQIDLPNLTVTEPNHPHVLAFRRYSSDQVIAFNRAQCDEIRRHSDAPIIHNFMGKTTDFDHFKLGADLDIASWDSYPIGFLSMIVDTDAATKLRYLKQGHPDFQAFHHDLYRACGKGRWWVMEQQPGPVNWAAWNPAPLPGMCRLWAWEAIAHGAECVSYFRWRQAPFAQEQMHAGLLRPDSAPAPALAEAAQVASEIEAMGEVGIAHARVALVFDYESCWGWQAQPQGRDFEFFRLAFEAYSALRRAGQTVDILPPDTADLSAYALVLAPGLMHLSDPLRAALATFDGIALIGPAHRYQDGGAVDPGADGAERAGPRRDRRPYREPAARRVGSARGGPFRPLGRASGGERAGASTPRERRARADGRATALSRGVARCGDVRCPRDRGADRRGPDRDRDARRPAPARDRDPSLRLQLRARTAAVAGHRDPPRGRALGGAVNRAPFGTTAAGEVVEAITLRAGDLSARILTYGAILNAVHLSGVPHSLTPGSGRFADYEAEGRHHGTLIGPVVNRLTGAQAPIAGKVHRFDENRPGPVTLHSGSASTGRKVWRIDDTRDDNTDSALSLRLVLPDGEGGFPGTRHVIARYEVCAPALLRLTVTATTDAPTLLNFANHSYWNLDGTERWEGHSLRIAADRYLPTHADDTPTGGIVDVTDTPYDFRTARVPVPGAPPLDHNFCLSDAPGPLRDVLWLIGQNGVGMTLATTAPGVQVFDARDARLPGGPVGQALAIEAQGWPDAPNHAGFPSIEVAVGESFQQIVEWRFSGD